MTAAELERLMEGLVGIGVGPRGGTTRLAWTDEDEQARDWFARRAGELGRTPVRDPAGNLWAAPDQPGPWWAVGSHLDSVVAGGRYDGALGVAAAFAVAAREPVAVIAFADEEGARFNTPTFGSRALAGVLDVEDALARTDAAGVTLREAVLSSGLDASALGRAHDWLERLRGFLELHIDQTTEVADSGLPLAVVSGLVARLRMQATVGGRADHAGTTRTGERHDAVSAAARLIVAGEELAGEAMTFTAARIEVEPNAPSTVAAAARVWLDARGPEADLVQRWRCEIEARARRIARATATEIALHVAAWSPGTTFASPVRERLLASAAEAPVEAAGGSPARELLCWAGHDAGILAAALPTGMVLVRNPTGISHSPLEDVSLADAAAATNALLGAVRTLL